MGPSLSDHVIAEILSYLPLKASTRLKTVCKSWHQLISTPYFRSLAMRRWASDDVLGFFVQGLDRDWMRLRLARHPDNKPTDQHLDGHGCIRILAVCDGIVFATDSKRTQYYVWNLSRGTTNFRCIPPPPLPAARGHYGLAKGSHCGSFEIVKLVNNELLDCSTWIYSSERGTWKRLELELPPLYRNIRVFSNHAGAACARRSILHWLTDCGMIIAFDSIIQQYRQMNLPSGIGNKDNVWLGTVDGELCILFLSTGRKAVELWVLENYDEVHWMKVMEVECPRIIGAPMFFDGERIAVAVFFVHDSRKRPWTVLYVYNTRSKKWEGAQLISRFCTFPCFIPFIRDETRFIQD